MSTISVAVTKDVQELGYAAMKKEQLEVVVGALQGLLPTVFTCFL